MNKKKQIAGFTLVETMMYVFLWGGVILVLLNVGLFLSTASMETVQRSLLTSESSNVTNRLFRDVKSASGFVEAQSNLGQALSQ